MSGRTSLNLHLSITIAPPSLGAAAVRREARLQAAEGAAAMRYSKSAGVPGVATPKVRVSGGQVRPRGELCRLMIQVRAKGLGRCYHITYII